MDSPKPFDIKGFFCPANTSRLEVRDEPVGVGDEESNLSLQLSLSCYHMSKNTAAIENKGKEHVSSKRNSEVAVCWDKIKSEYPSSETTHLSLGLGLYPITMYEEKKETIRFLTEEGISNYQRENDHQVLNPNKFEGLSLQLSLGSNDASCSNSKKRKSPKSKRGVSSLSKTKKRRTKVASEEEIITELRLGRQSDDPWRIKKKLSISDIGHLSRLLLAAEVVKAHILPFWNADQIAKIEEGFPVFVWDCNTKTEHELVFAQWNKGRANVLKKNWVTDFVKRRELKKNDEIGLYWDEGASRFNFAVLNRCTVLVT